MSHRPFSSSRVDERSPLASEALQDGIELRRSPERECSPLLDFGRAQPKGFSLNLYQGVERCLQAMGNADFAPPFCTKALLSKGRAALRCVRGLALKAQSDPTGHSPASHWTADDRAQLLGGLAVLLFDPRWRDQVLLSCRAIGTDLVARFCEFCRKSGTDATVGASLLSLQELAICTLARVIHQTPQCKQTIWSFVSAISGSVLDRVYQSNLQSASPTAPPNPPKSQAAKGPEGALLHVLQALERLFRSPLLASLRSLWSWGTLYSCLHHENADARFVALRCVGLLHCLADQQMRRLEQALLPSASF